MVPRSPGRVLFLAASLLVLVAPASVDVAHADPLAALGGEALDVSADELEVDVHAGTALLTGNVTLAKGGLKVACPKLEVRYDDAPRVTWAKGSGGVKADVKGVHAEAPEVELDLGKHLLDLRGGVRLARGQGWLEAEKATIEIGSGKVTLKDVKGSIPVGAPKP